MMRNVTLTLMVLLSFSVRTSLLHAFVMGFILLQSCKPPYKQNVWTWYLYQVWWRVQLIDLRN